MASLSRGAGLFRRPRLSLCFRCRQAFATSAISHSGHNKWSKIKHGKAANDAKKNSSRNEHGRIITLLAKLYGPDPTFNPQLANAMIAAKRASVPKTVIDTAIARAQGKSSGGAVLEGFTFDVILPPSIAIVIEAETDNRTRTLHELNAMVKKAKGAASPSKFYFTRVGRVVFEKPADAEVGIDQIMDDAIEAGAEDLENDDDGNIIVWTQPSQTVQVCQEVGNKFGLKVLSFDIVWNPNEDTKASLDSSDELEKFVELLRALREQSEVQAVYSNVVRGEMSDAEWDQIEENLDI
ncbi:YebC-like protein [Thozetella sp. PMI_491]|nr:YebC-like protein [Thozetella sp. PMI_491]